MDCDIMESAVDAGWGCCEQAASETIMTIDCLRASQDFAHRDECQTLSTLSQAHSVCEEQVLHSTSSQPKCRPRDMYW
jgi:hypothetical protein